MAISKFLRTVWSARITQAIDEASVYAALCNRNWEGDAANAKSVKIGQVGAINVNSYTKSTDITWQELSDSDQTLAIDQQNYFAFEVEDIDRAQTVAPIMEEATRKGGVAIAKTLDVYLKGLFDNAVAANTDTQTTKFADLNTAAVLNALELTKNNIMNDGHTIGPGDVRMVVPPVIWNRWSTLLTTVGYNFADQQLLNGFGGRVAGVDLFVSSQVNKTDSSANWACPVAVRNQPVTLASQIAEIEAMRLQNIFADGIRGLFVYGAKVVKSDSLYLLKLKVA